MNSDTEREASENESFLSSKRKCSRDWSTNTKNHLRKFPNEAIRKADLKIRIVKLMKEVRSPKEIMLQLESEGYKVKHREKQIRSYYAYAERRVNKWTFEHFFNGIDDAKIYLKRQKIWSLKFQNRSHFGMTYHYRCQLVPKVGPQCAARKYFSFNSCTKEVKLYQRDCLHTHKEIMRLDNGKKTDWLLKQFYKGDRNALMEHGFRVLEAVSLQNCLVGSKTSNQIKSVELNLYEGKQDEIQNTFKSRPFFTSDWIFEYKFPNEQMALEYLAKDNIWQYDHTNIEAEIEGYEVHYRCNRMNGIERQCVAGKYLFYSIDSDEISVYKTSSEHTHESIPVNYNRTYKRKSAISDCIGRRLLNQNSEHATINEGSIINQTKVKQFKNGCSVVHVSNDCHVAPVEIVVGDDSTPYVIKCIDDDEANYEGPTAQVIQVAAISSDGNSNWLCEKSFSSFEDAQKYIKESEWENFKTTTIKNQSKIFYRCRMIEKFGPQCAAQAYLLCCNENYFFYRNTAQHTHDQTMERAVISSCSGRNQSAQMKVDNRTDTTMNNFFLNKKQIILPDTYPNSNIIVKEELIIDGEPVAAPQNDGVIYGQITVSRKGRFEEEMVENKTETSAPATEKIVGPEENQPEPPSATEESIPESSITPILHEVAFEKFPNQTEAIHKMRQEADHWASTHPMPVETGYRMYFRCCNYSPDVGRCTCRVFLLGRNDSDEVLYYLSSQHNHKLKLSKAETTKILNPSKSNENHDEIIISDDSDNESFNNQSEWTFDTKFQSHTTAKLYMQRILNLINSNSNLSGNYIKEYYGCASDSSGIAQCPASRYLLYKDLTDEVLMFYKNIQHIDGCVNITAPVSIQKHTSDVIELVDSDDNDDNDDSNSITVIESDTDENIPKILEDGKRWLLAKEFKTHLKAYEYLKEQGIWTFEATRESEGIVKEFYKCNLTKKSGEECAAEKCLYINSTANEFSIYTNGEIHTHNPLTQASRSIEIFENIDDAFNDKIKVLVTAGYKPKQILDELGQLPAQLKKDNLYCYIMRLRRKMRLRMGSKPPFTKTIEAWLSQNTAIPTATHKPYCVSFNVDHSNKSFRCFFSTRRLLKNAVDSNLVHLDTTSTLHWQDNPVTIIGTTDLDQKLHLFGIAICTNKKECDYEFIFKTVQKGVQECHKKRFKPECLVTDDSEAVRDAFIKMFGISSKIGMCSKVALSKIMVKLSACVESDLLKNQIEEEILKMQKLSSSSLFFKALDLFFEKWRLLGDVKLDRFLKYFEMNWVNRNRNWFLGFRLFTPHTNKAISTEYDLLKNSLPFAANPKTAEAFRCLIRNEIERLSRRYTKLGSQFVRETTVPKYVYEKASDWDKFEKQFEIHHHDKEIHYYIPSGGDNLINKQKLRKYRACYHDTLDEFLEINFSFWCVRQLKRNNKFRCTCPYFLENFVCEHSVGIAKMLNINRFPPKVSF